MCGIAGYAGTPRALPTHAILAELSPRGPDGRGTTDAAGDGWSATLLHTRLSIMDLSDAAAQPMHDGRGWSLVFNGEIYNHAELRADLRSRGEVFTSSGDTEVVLKGLVLHGPAFLEKLRGPFALALLERASGALLLARDRLGVNPLYVSESSRGLAFASTVRALHAGGLCSHRLDVRALCGLLFYGSVPEPLSLVEDVRELPPGTWLRRHVNGTTTGRFWRMAAEDPRMTYADAVASVRDALHSAVAAELVSDVPVALLLSGGLDSGAVAALAARAATGNVDAFTVGFEGGTGTAVDESALARETADALGLRHHVVHVDVTDGARALMDALAAQDIPSMDGINTHLVSGAIRNAGYKVALSGLGGDELFLGYANRRNFHRLARLPDAGVSSSVPRVVASLARSLGVSARVERALSTVLPPRGVAGAYAAVRTIMGPASVLAMLHPDLRPRVAPEDLDPVSYLDTSALPADVDGALSRLELRHYMRSTLLKDANILSLGRSLELRVPMVDWQLVDAVLRVPGHLRARGTGKKPLLLAALQGVLPAGIENRPKVGFVLPLRAWLDAASPAADAAPHAYPLVDVPADSTPARLVDAAVRAAWRRTPLTA